VGWKRFWINSQKPAQEEVVQLTDFNVLLVDDELEFLETLVKRLRKRKLNTTGVGSGEQALEVLRTEPVDVVVLDVKMPGMDGIETLRAIKKMRPLVEVIMLTGHANMEVAITGMELGAFDYLMKPMDIDELLYKLQDAFKRKLLQEQKIHVVKEEMGIQT
jgi:DNA-binding NtrC family response regulator